MKIIKFVVCLLTALSIAGCMYTEGDDKAVQSFKLMTSQEKAMHDKVVKEFTEKAVMSVRDAVRRRSVKPTENSIAFLDIANVIKHCNETILIPRDFWNKERSIEEAERARFSAQDPTWYRKILMVAGGGNELDEGPPIKSKPMSMSEVREKIEENLEKLELSKVRVEVNLIDLLPLEDYLDVEYLARGCDSAIAIIEVAASQDRPLTLQDRTNITYEKSICETKKLNDNL